jgi:hypothetical protein
VTASLVGGATQPANQSVVVQFNRLLNPGTVNRQTVTLLEVGANGATPFVDPVVVYDPVLLTVTLSSPTAGSGWLTSGQTYEVRIPVATPATEGVLAIDNATVAKEVDLEFMALSAEAGASAPPPEPTMHFCVDVLPIFNAKCNLSTCHASPSSSDFSTYVADSGALPKGSVAIYGAVAGLVLDNSQGVLDTAVGQVAYESNAGPFASPSSAASCPTTNTASCVFGVDMPIIDPGTNGSGDPANSWLIYKMLLASPSTSSGAPAMCGALTTTEYTPSPPTTAVLSSAERATLSNYIPGREMPYPASAPTIAEGQDAGSTSALSMQELERVRLWIQQGATVENCAHCDGDAAASPLPGDAGVVPGDAQPSDGAKGASTDAGVKG